MEENELEEGEAFSGQEDNACIDPDIALSYIDEKLQDVLGHFQKDFEGGVSAENLGAKFGGYGSFLPCYQRSPSILNQPKSPLRPANHTISRSPCNSSVEGVRQNPSVAANVSITRNNTASTTQVNNLGSGPTTQPNNSSKRENGMSSQGAGRFVPQHDASNKKMNNSDQKSLKVRLKVGPDNSFARNNAAIYSGLGLDVSPSPSPEDSPDDSGGGSPEFRDSAGESPVTILQVMTCFSVPGGYLLSPLHEHLFHLSEKEISSVENSFMLRKVVSESSAAANSTLPMRGSKGYSDKKAKPNEKNGRLVEADLNCKSETRKILEKEIDIETPAGQKLLSNALSIPLLSSLRDPDAKMGKQMVADPLKVTSRMSDHAKNPNKTSVKDRMSISDIHKDDRLASTESVKSCGLGNSENESAQSKGKLNSKISLVDKALERRPIDNCKDTSSDILRDSKSKPQKSDDMFKLNSDGSKDKDNIAGHAGPIKQVPSQKANSHAKDGVMIQCYDQVHEGKDKHKGSHNNSVPSVDSTKDNLRAPSVVPKEKKKISHAMGDHSQNKSKMVKSRKEISRGCSKESHGEVVRNLIDERLEPRANLLEPFMFTEEPKERPGLKKDDNLGISEQLANASAIPPLTGTVPTSDAAAALHAPVLIEDNWVQCDKCQKWRLLPYGTDPEHLPKKWKCSMQIWLQGLNRCSIPEEETTKAFNALYLVPAPGTGANLNGHHDIAASSITSADPLHIAQRHEHTIQTVPTAGKKKHKVMDTSNQPNHSSSKKNLHASFKSKRSNDVNEFPLEMNSLTKAGVGNMSKSAEVMMENHSRKQKEKHKIPGRYSDGGDFVEKSGKHSKSKSKREIDQDGVRTSKKFKKEGAHFLVEDRLSDLEMASKAAPVVDNGLSTAVAGKILQNCSDHSSSKDCETKGNILASIKRSKGSTHVLSSEEFKEHVSALPVEKSGTLDFAAKKRKLKEWQESKAHQDALLSVQHTPDNRITAKDAFGESELWKQKKAKVSTSEGRAPTMSDTEGKMDKKGRSTKILLSGSREYPPDQVDEEERVAAGKEEMGHYHENAPSRRALDGADSSKIYAQLPTAAASSSSKVSSSRKTKANVQEVKGSPVESVSSSPLRIPNTEKPSTKSYSMVKDDVVEAGLSYMASPKRCSDGEVDGGSDQSGTQRKEFASCGQLRSLEGHRATESGDPGSLRENHSYQDKEASQLSGDKAKGAPCLKRASQIDVSAEFEETNMVGDTGKALEQNNNYNSEGPEKDNFHCRDRLHNQHHQNGPPSQSRSNKSSSLSFRDRNKNSASDADRTKLKVKDSIGGKELYSVKNVSNYQSEVVFNCNENSADQEDARDENYNIQDKDEAYLGKKNSSGKWSHANRRGNYSNKEIEHNLDTRNKDFNSKAMVGGSSCKSNFQENLQPATSYPIEQSSHISDRIDRSGTSGRVILQSVQPSKDKHEAQSWVAQTVPTPTKGSNSEVCPTDSVNKSRKPDNQNGMRVHSLRQATSNGHDSASPLRKDGPAAAHLLKEARDLKHTANRMKQEGLEHESINIYFQSALKFLHYSSLLEPSSADITRQGESQLKHMMVTYSETAKLCRYCALEYERVKDMAAAALAYKCVEVAYMKTTYYKHPGASKDRNELQAALQTALPGESPSSSASDVDNLNNQGALDKTASAKAVGSPQIAGNYVIAARNRPHLTGLLSYANDVISALDATKKSQSAIAAASINLDKDGGDGLSSVRKVLDFNYHNVEGLLRLVRLSIELISR